MLMTVQEFREYVEDDLDSLIVELQFITGRTGAEEVDAWRASLPRLSAALASPAFSPLHLHFPAARLLALEYQLPAASSWCDVVLLGRDDGHFAAVVIELKDWATWGDAPGPYEGLMIRRGSIVLHPSEQVRGYADYCKRFHSAVQEYGAKVSGCVLFTRDPFVHSYVRAPNHLLTGEYPCFSAGAPALREALPQYLTERVATPDTRFANDFANGTYRQERGFVSQIGAQILAPDSSPFELLDNQRRAYAMVRARLENALFNPEELRKQVILIDGPPGSGKSVLAARIWASLVTDKRLPDGAVVLTTTSTSQTSNWVRLFQRAAGTQAAGGVVKKAASYVPVSTQGMGQLRQRYGQDFLGDPGAWRENVRLLRNLGVPFREGAHDEQYLVSIVDEAHALINPERPEGRGQFGFTPTLGPLAWQIIRASKVSIFLLDAEQGFRDRENTAAGNIEGWANELGADVVDRISLEGAQFRCAGSKEYVAWVEAVLNSKSPARAREFARMWQQVLDFRIFETPAALESALRERVAAGRSARLVASFARPWKTRDAANPHELPPNLKDFHEPFVEDGHRRYWTRIWNFIPRGSDYTWFIQALEGSRIYADPLCEVGCPYAVRGFDFEYVGVLWLGDLKHRGGQWTVDTAHVHETGLTRTLELARRGPPGGPAREELRRALAQAYRILLTRGIYGLYVWFEDSETRAFLEECLINTGAETARR